MLSKEESMVLNNNQDKKRKLCADIVFWSFASQMIYTILKRVLINSPYGELIAIIIAFPYLAYLLIKYIFKYGSRIEGAFLTSIIVTTLLYLLSLFSGVPPKIIAIYYPWTMFCLLLLIFTYKTEKLELIYNKFAKYGIFLAIFSALIVIVDRSSFAYNMHYSYILALVLFIHTVEFIKKKKIWLLLVLALELMLILIYGSRGPVLCYAIFLAIYVLLDNKKISIKVLFGAVILSISLFMDRIISFIGTILGKYNINSRTLSLLVENIGHTSGRDTIAATSIQLIKEHPLTGLGIAGEFKYMQDYPHNLILDIFIHWGIIIGTILLIYLLYLVVDTIIKSKEIERTLLLVFMSYGLVMLFFSGTYLNCDGFFIMLGIIFRIRNNYNEQNNAKIAKKRAA